MNGTIEFEAVREGRGELARQVARERLAGRLRHARQRPWSPNALAGRFAALLPGRPEAAR